MTSDASKAVVRRWFEAVEAGAADLSEMLAEDVRWWVPPGSPLGGTYEGKAAVLGLMSSGIDRYDAATPLRIEVVSILAEGERVAAEVVLEARTARGEDYRNHYHFAFRVAGGKLREVREYVDTRYAQQKLFDPAARVTGP